MYVQLNRVVGVFCLVVVLAGIYWGISALNTPRPAPTPAVPAPALPVSGGQDMAQQQNSIETEQVTVTFKDGGKVEFSLDIPLEVEKNPASQTIEKITLRPEIVQQVVDTIPEASPAAPGQPAKAIADNKGTLKKIVRGMPRETIDRQAALRQITEALQADPASRAFSLALVRKPAAGEVTFEAKLAELGFTVPLGEGETIHDAAHQVDEHRNVNLRLAAEKVDGVILQPGEEFSFNRVVGERSRKNGYVPAGVISNGRVVPGLGGGVCQVSTSIYNAALLANLKITERHNHSIYEGIPYAKRGRDAAVAWGAKDFRFKNTLPFPIAISCITRPGFVKAVIFGQKKLYDRVEIATRNEKVLPFSVQKKAAPKKKGIAGSRIVRPGVTGYTIETFRIVTRGASTTEERLHQDHYLMFPQVEEVGN